jgi:hypothetical protein
MTARMPRLEKTDYPSLDMGHSFSRTEVSIVGLEVQVYGLEEIRGSSKPIIGLVSRVLFIPASFFFLSYLSIHFVLDNQEDRLADAIPDRNTR